MNKKKSSHGGGALFLFRPCMRTENTQRLYYITTQARCQYVYGISREGLELQLPYELSYRLVAFALR